MLKLVMSNGSCHYSPVLALDRCTRSNWQAEHHRDDVLPQLFRGDALRELGTSDFVSIQNSLEPP